MGYPRLASGKCTGSFGLRLIVPFFLCVAVVGLDIEIPFGKNWRSPENTGLQGSTVLVFEERLRMGRVQVVGVEGELEFQIWTVGGTWRGLRRGKMKMLDENELLEVLDLDTLGVVVGVLEWMDVGVGWREQLTVKVKMRWEQKKGMIVQRHFAVRRDVVRFVRLLSQVEPPEVLRLFLLTSCVPSQPFCLPAMMNVMIRARY